MNFSPKCQTSLNLLKSLTPFLDDVKVKAVYCFCVYEKLKEKDRKIDYLMVGVAILDLLDPLLEGVGVENMIITIAFQLPYLFLGTMKNNTDVNNTLNMSMYYCL